MGVFWCGTYFVAPDVLVAYMAAQLVKPLNNNNPYGLCIKNYYTSVYALHALHVHVYM